MIEICISTIEGQYAERIEDPLKGDIYFFWGGVGGVFAWKHVQEYANYNFRHKLLGRFDHEQNSSKILFILSKYVVIT